MADLGALAKGPAPGVYDDTFKLARTVNLMASVAAGVTAYDTVYPDIKNLEGLRAEARTRGAWATAARSPSIPTRWRSSTRSSRRAAQEIDWAKRVVATFESNPGSGVLTLDGKMLDRPHLVLARRLLARAGWMKAKRRAFSHAGPAVRGPARFGPHARGVSAGSAGPLLRLRHHGAQPAELHPDRHSLAVDGNRPADAVAIVAQSFAGRPSPSLPGFDRPPRPAARQAAGFPDRIAPRSSSASRAPVHARHEGWVTGRRGGCSDLRGRST